jgi:hypothetical protein
MLLNRLSRPARQTVQQLVKTDGGRVNGGPKPAEEVRLTDRPKPIR